MMQGRCTGCRLAALMLAASAALSTGAEAVEIARQADKSLLVVARNYRAMVDANGHFRSLQIGGKEFLDDAAIRRTGDSTATRKGGAASAPSAEVSAQGDVIAVTLDGARLRWTFGETGIGVETEGGALEYRLSKSVSAFVLRNGQVVDRATSAGDVAKVVVGSAAFSLDQPFHHTFGRLWPSLLARGGKAETALSYRIECGVPVGPAELISVVSLEAVGQKPKAAPTYAAGQRPQVKLNLRNLGQTDANAEARFRVLDHPVQPKTVLDKALPISLTGGEANAVSLDVPLSAAGLYWVRAEIVSQGKPLQETQLGIVYDAQHYRPPLTRPADFRDFWDNKLKEMRAVPFDEKLSESAAEGNERFVHYDLEIAVAKGKRIKTFLRVPRKGGAWDAEVHSHWGSDSPDKIMAGLVKFEKQEAGAGMWQRGADRIRVGAPQPEDSTYKRWVSRDDNNMLESFLLNVRMADYLRSRKDVRNLWLFGASRSGASMLAAAALSPERVVAVNVHVPTCCGLSWADKPYRGWGQPPAQTEEGLRVAAYFDPVNFAPDLAAPVVMDGGFYDGLAPAPGILAFANWAEKAPFKRCAILLGGHGFFPPDDRQRMEKELSGYLKEHEK